MPNPSQKKIGRRQPQGNLYRNPLAARKTDGKKPHKIDCSMEISPQEQSTGTKLNVTHTSATSPTNQGENLGNIKARWTGEET